MRLTEIQDTKICLNLSSAHDRTDSLGYIFTNKACIDSRKKTC